jgi:hypothetical protein
VYQLSIAKYFTVSAMAAMTSPKTGKENGQTQGHEEGK